jgi:hypothetical protein
MTRQIGAKYMVDWEQNAKDAQQILCDSGDLLRECHDSLFDLGNEELAAKVRKFCNRVQRCMEECTKWEDTPE